MVVWDMRALAAPTPNFRDDVQFLSLLICPFRGAISEASAISALHRALQLRHASNLQVPRILALCTRKMKRFWPPNHVRHTQHMCFYAISVLPLGRGSNSAKSVFFCMSCLTLYIKWVIIHILIVCFMSSCWLTCMCQDQNNPQFQGHTAKLQLNCCQSRFLAQLSRSEHAKCSGKIFTTHRENTKAYRRHYVTMLTACMDLYRKWSFAFHNFQITCTTWL